MLEVIFLVAGLYSLFIGRITVAHRVLRGGRVRFAGLILLITLALDSFVWGMTPVSLSIAEAQGTVNQMLLIGFVGAFLLILVAFVAAAPSRISLDMMTLREAANYFLVPEQTLQQLVQQDALKTSRIGTQRYVSKSAVGRYLNKQTEPVNNILPDLPE